MEYPWSNMFAYNMFFEAYSGELVGLAGMDGVINAPGLWLKGGKRTELDSIILPLNFTRKKWPDRRYRIYWGN